MDESLAGPTISFANSFSAPNPNRNQLFNVVFLNIRSLRKGNRLDDLTNFVLNSPTKIDVVILNETSLDLSDIQYFNLPFFNAFHSVRNKRGGGAVIYVRSSLSNANLVLNVVSDNASYLVVHLDRLNLHVGTVYKPPDVDTKSFLPHFDELLSKFPKLFMFGDFNINLFKSYDGVVRAYNEVVSSNGFKILNPLDSFYFTRHDLVHNSYSCIDHAMTDLFLDFRFHFSFDSILDSDHRALFLQMASTISKGGKR